MSREDTKKMEFGLNLFSIRSLIGTEEKFLDTAKKLKDMGYSFIQFSGCPYNADMISRVSTQSGLPVVLTHVPMDRILNDTDALMEEHLKFGCRNIGLGMMDLKIITNETVCKETVEKLDRAAERMERNGFKFFYHNHHFEFYKHNGQTVFDYMIDNAKHISFTLDTYWVQYGGYDLLSLIQRLDGRIDCVHLKDYRIEAIVKENESIELVPRFAPVGDGNLDFKSIIPKMKQSGAKYFLVEQDNASDMAAPLSQVERSIKYLKKEF